MAKSKKSIVTLITMALLILCVAWCQSAYADSSDKLVPYKLTFKDTQGNVLYQEEGKAPAGTAVGPDEDIQVRSTYYKEGKDYDIDKEATKSSYPTAKLSQEAKQNDLVYVYKEHVAKGVKIRFVMVSDGAALQEKVETVTADKDLTFTPEKSITVGGETYNCRDTKAITVKYSNIEKTTYEIPYELAGDSQGHYNVSVKYVDRDTKEVLATRSFRVKGQDYVFYAPTVYSISRDGKTVRYGIVGENVISHKVTDSKGEYTVEYAKEGNKESYSWFVTSYDAASQKVLSQKELKVKPKETQKYEPAKTLEVEGVTYRLSKASQETLTHKYGDWERHTAVFYEAEGTEAKEKTREIKVLFRNVKDNSILQEKTIEVSSKADKEVEIPATFGQDGNTYRRIDGQKSKITASYYGTQNTYTEYYVDEKDTTFETPVIEEHRTEQITLIGPDNEVYLPDTVRYVVVDRGVRRVVSTTAANGTQLSTGNDGNVFAVDGNGDNATAAADGDNGASVDGVEANEVQTARGNVDLNKNTKSAMPLWVKGLAAAVAVALIAAIIFVITRGRRKNEHA